MLDLEWPDFLVHAFELVGLDLLRGESFFIVQHLQLEGRHLQVVECVVDGVLYLRLVELPLHRLVLIILQPVQVRFNLLFQSVRRDFGLTVLVLLLECCSVALCVRLRLVLDARPICVLPIQLLPLLDLGFVEKVVVVHELEILKVVSVSLAHIRVAVFH